MFYSFGYFNNPFMMMNNWFMPNFSYNFFMPNLFLTPSIFQFNWQMPVFTTGISSNIFGFLNTQTVQNTNEGELPAFEKEKVNPESGVKSDDFLTRTKRVAQKVNCDYRDLLSVMNSESGLNPKAVNPNGGATGLIQFMPSTAKELGTSTDALKKMSAVEQLDYVEKYYLNTKKRAGFNSSEKLDAGDLYALTFLPARAKREVLTDSSEIYYTSNKGLDKNNDGKITKTELAQRITSRRVNESIFA